MAIINYYPDTFKWARTHRRLTTIQAAKTLKITHKDLKEIESGVKKMTLTLLRKISKRYMIPHATLLLPNPPTNIKKDPDDYRTLEGRPPTLSLETLGVIGRIRAYQDKLEELVKIDPKLGGPPLMQYRIHGDASKLGERERSRINISVDDQIEWHDDEEAFRKWRRIIEDLGICVYMEAFPISDCKGISLLDHANLPALIINKNEKWQVSKIFSLIHEYAHIMVDKPGLSDRDDRNSIEAFCNKFAAGFLIPKDALKKVLPTWPPKPIEWEYAVIKRVAKLLKVSQQSMALRLEQVGLAPEGFYDRFKTDQPKLTPIDRPVKGYPSVATKRIFALGRRFSTAIIYAADKGLISYVDATAILNAPKHKLQDMRMKLNMY